MKPPLVLLLPACMLLVIACPKDDDESGEGQACWLDEPEFLEGEESQSIMETWGAPCEADADCVPLLGDNAICAQDAVIFELPGGYCTKDCTVDLTHEQQAAGQAYEENDTEECDPEGGVNCLGQNGIFTRCALPCTSDAQCSRDGYACRLMPEISRDTDPKYCLMSDCCEVDCGGDTDAASGTATSGSQRQRQ